MMTGFCNQTSQNEQFVPVGLLIAGANRSSKTIRTSIALNTNAANLQAQDDEQKTVIEQNVLVTPPKYNRACRMMLMFSIVFFHSL